MLSEGADLRSTHVPYRGNTPAVTAVVAGEVDGGILATPGLLPFVRSGRVVALAVTGTRRSALLPGVPTAIESGVPGLVLEVLYVAMVPFATPPAIVDVLRTRLVESLAPADVRADPAVVEAYLGAKVARSLEARP
jgi:tripartite-type tricarboxylate transporter receptor subunit TctC